MNLKAQLGRAARGPACCISPVIHSGLLHWHLWPEGAECSELKAKGAIRLSSIDGFAVAYYDDWAELTLMRAGLPAIVLPCQVEGDDTTRAVNNWMEFAEFLDKLEQAIASDPVPR